VFTAGLPSNGHFCSFHYSGFQPPCYIIVFRCIVMFTHSDIQAHLTLDLALSHFFADQICKISGRLVATWYSMTMNDVFISLLKYIGIINVNITSMLFVFEFSGNFCFLL
jgi:hypothetical protein